MVGSTDMDMVWSARLSPDPLGRPQPTGPNALVGRAGSSHHLQAQGTDRATHVHSARCPKGHFHELRQEFRVMDHVPTASTLSGLGASLPSGKHRSSPPDGQCWLRRAGAGGAQRYFILLHILVFSDLCQMLFLLNLRGNMMKAKLVKVALLTGY